MSRVVRNSSTMRVTIDTRGVEYIRRVLVVGSPRMRKALTDSAYVVFGFWHRRFLRGANWPALTQRTREQKEKAGYSPSLILRATDQLITAVNPAIKGANVPGRLLRVSAKKLNVRLGYGGTAVYRGADPKYARSFSWGGGTIASLADIHARGAYRAGKIRRIIIEPDASVSRRVEIILQKGFNDEIGIANGMS